MSWDSDFEDLMPHTVTIATVASRDEYNKRTYSTAVTYTARVLERMTRVVDREGRETIATHVVWIAPHADSGAPALEPDAEITLPDGSTPPIIRVESIPDEDGDHHVKVYLGATGS